MAKETVMAGCAAAAHAAKFARVEVISSYPIRPYTGIMMELSKLVANGELDAEFVHRITSYNVCYTKLLRRFWSKG